MRFLRWVWHGDPEAVEHARQADHRATIDLARALENAARTHRILEKNHLTERFIRELRGGHA